MPASPFGGHPRLADFLRWARDQKGCAVQFGLSLDAAGQPVAIIRIENPATGKWAIAGSDQMEFLAPAELGRLLRRLGLEDAPWFSVDPPDDHD